MPIQPRGQASRSQIQSRRHGFGKGPRVRLYLVFFLSRKGRDVTIYHGASLQRIHDYRVSVINAVGDTGSSSNERTGVIKDHLRSRES